MVLLFVLYRLRPLLIGPLVGLLCILPAFGQGFQVRPMVMQFGAPAGQTAETTLDLTNTASFPLSLRLYAVDLTQTPTGSWQMIPPGSDADLTKLSSALSWTSIQATSVDLPPATTEQVPIRFTIPPNARGTYLAGIIAEQPTPEGAQGLIIRVRFLIPVIIQIEGRPVRQNVKIAAVGLERIDATEGNLPTTNLTMGVLNDGRTYSKIRGQIALQVESGGQWRTITRSEVPERGIIPGVAFSLPVDIGRRLPSGTYRVRGELFVDGRRVAPMEQEIPFEGDPAIDELAFDTALLLEPAVVSIEVTPGATRTTILTVENPGSDPVNVSMVSATPRALQGMVMGDLMGVSLSAEPWTQIRPAQFTLRPGRRQNVRVISRVPAEGALYPNYYADLVLQGTYADGQSAGETRSMVHLLNQGVEETVSAIVEQFALSETDQPGQFSAQARLINTGNVHFEPNPALQLLTPRGEVLSTVALTGEPGILLPLGIRTFGGELNLSDVEPGYYVLRALFPLTPGVSVTDQHIVLIEEGEATELDGDVVSAPTVTVDPEGAEIDVEPGMAVPVEEPTQEGAGG